MSILNFAEQDDLTQTHFCDCWVLEQIATHVDAAVGLTFVPRVILELPAAHRSAAIDAIKRAAMEGLIELRPDGGLCRFSQSELDAAPAAWDGSSLLWARAIAA